MKRRLITIIMLFIICTTILPVLGNSGKVDAFSVTRDQAVEWLIDRGQNQKGINLPATNYGYQCTDFVSGYMNWLVTGDPYNQVYVPYSPSYYPTVAGWNPDRWEVIRNYDAFVPEPGDIFVSNYHVGVVVSSTAATAWVVEQNTRAGYNDTTGTLPWYHQITWRSSGYGTYGATHYIRFKQFALPIPSTPRGSEMTSGYDRVLPDGNYMIASSADPAYFLDIIGGAQPAAEGENVNLWHTGSGNIGDCDAWTIKYSDGFYRISQYVHARSLDVEGADTLRGKNIQVWGSNDSSAQKWAISEFWQDGNMIGYRMESKCSGYSLDINGGTLAEGTNIQQYEDNNSNAQAWVFIPYKPEQPVENGRYIIVSAKDDSLELDVSGDSNEVESGTNVQAWHDDSKDFAVKSLSQYNSFDIKKLSDGYYSVTHAGSGKALDSDGFTRINAKNIHLWDNFTNDAQKWAITRHNEGYMFRVKCSGYALDLADGITDNGTNVRQNKWNGSQAQTWKLVKAEYRVAYNANGGSGAPSPQIKYYKGNLNLSSKTPYREGCIFIGWNTKSDGSGKNFVSGTIYSTDQDLTLYAIWKTNTFTIKRYRTSVSEKQDLSAIKIVKPKASKKSMIVKWKKVSKKKLKIIKMIQIQYSPDKTFRTGVRTKYVKARKKSIKIKKLKSKKKYYVRIRAYTKSGSTLHVSKWSARKSVKVK